MKSYHSIKKTELTETIGRNMVQDSISTKILIVLILMFILPSEIGGIIALFGYVYLVFYLINRLFLM